MLNVAYIAAIPLLPLACFVVLGIPGKKYFSSTAGQIGTIVLAATTILSLLVAFQYFFIAGKVNGEFVRLEPLKLSWLSFSSSLSIDMGIILDPISVMMIVIVSFVSLMVHMFSVWYMKGEERYATYYAFLSLFTFSMLGLVLSANLFQIYIFWELVGVSSFLLIGYYYQKPSAVAAAKKAFIVTRFADFGFLVGILVLAFYSDTLDFNTLIARLTDVQSSQSLHMHSATFLGISAFTWALTLVFIGGAGKSAMFPLHIWLPDAMEGPTPVSALIHAATMVVAGVYLVARLFPLYSLDADALAIVRYTGVSSGVLAAIIACTQTDIKRVLAFSTMSQIGFMMFSLGLLPGDGGNSTGYMAAMFHLFTHAFFKSLLFLGAGAIIHNIHSNDLRDMGGLRKSMPLTHIVFLIGCLAIAGIPPFAGFFSKEAFLLAAYEKSKSLYYIALFTGALTAFYMFRLYFSIFWSKDAATGHPKSEGNAWMRIPLVILAACSLLVGFLPFSAYVTANGQPMETHIHIGFALLPVLAAVLGIGIAAWLYKTANDKPASLATALGGLYSSAYRKFYIDEVYLFATKKILFNMVGKPAAWFDRNIVDGTMTLLASTTAGISNLVKGWQSGQVQRYTIIFFGGILAMGIIFIYLWK